ncbi:hypothetical protein BGX33_011990 [Mortierella sp. NVP41]|nr:hypothetical protein BGX33_011990 [Mortierella sp. NVP41]
MPTYGPVPASFSSLSHRRQVLFLYRHILRQGACFFDERASHWIRARAQETFRKNQSQKDEHRIQKYMSDARKGATGKSVKPVLPQPLFKPLHGKREANLRWRFYTKQMGKVKPPLPGQIRQEIERKSRIGLQRPPRIGTSGFGGDITETLETTQEWIEWEQRIIATIKAWNKTGEEQKANRWENGRFHPSIGGKPAKSHILTLRSYRRIWQQLLNEVPILDVKLGGEGSDHGKDSMNNKDVLKGTSRDKDSGTGTRWSEQTQTQTSVPSYLVSKSPQSYQARSAAGLKLQALVNDFDQLGFTEDSVAPQGKKNRKKALTA